MFVIASADLDEDIYVVLNLKRKLLTSVKLQISLKIIVTSSKLLEEIGDSDDQSCSSEGV